MPARGSSTVKAFPEKRKRSSLRFVLGISLACVLLVWFLNSFPVLDSNVWALVGRYPRTIGSIALGSALLMTLLSAVKWHLLLRKADLDLTQSLKFNRLFAYTSLSSALGQIVPPYIAGPVVRGSLMKSQHDANFARSAILAGYEQVFDVAALLMGGIAALSLLLGGIGGTIGVVCVALSLALATALMYALPDRFRLMQVVAILPKRWTVTARIRASVHAGSTAGLDTPRLLGHLTALSVLRYGVLVIRTAGMGLVLLPLVPWETLALGFGAVQLSAIAALTPGNLGISELGWSAMTIVTDRATMGEFIAFALALRVSGLLASAVLAVLSLFYLMRA